MAKFTVGDKVRVNNKNVYNIHNKTGIVLGYYQDKYIRVKLDKEYVINECYLEKVIDDEELTRQCLFENADALDNCFVPLKRKQTLTPDKLERYDQAISKYINKEGEEKKMKEIKNQKVVDLYFKRKNEEIDKRHAEACEKLIKSDKNQIFVEELTKQYYEYFEENKDDFQNDIDKCKIELPLTKETDEKFIEIDSQFRKESGHLKELKEEILALLSGCDTYEQEMEILQTYSAL